MPKSNTLAILGIPNFASRARRRAGLEAFDSPAVVILPGPNVFRRGMGSNYANTYGNALGTTYGSLFGIDPATGNFTFLAPLNTAYDAVTGQIDPSQQAQILAADQAANLQAATNPVTGVVNQQLLNAANQASAAGVGPASNVSNVSTGNYVGNLFDALTGTYTGSLGLPGTTSPLGTTSGSTGDSSSQPEWVTILEDLGIALGAVLLIYIGVRIVKDVF